MSVGGKTGIGIDIVYKHTAAKRIEKSTSKLGKVFERELVKVRFNVKMDPIKIFLRNRLVSDKTTLIGYAQESYQIKELISRTVNCGESNSALIIGPNGCGKSTVSLSQLQQYI